MSRTEHDDVDWATAAEQSAEDDEAQTGNVNEHEEQSSEPAEHVAVHLLAAGQADVARTFATRGINRFAPTPWHPGPFGLPLLDGALAWLVGRVTARITAGDHAIVLAEPVEVDYADGAPLLYHNGHYTALT